MMNVKIDTEANTITLVLPANLDTPPASKSGKNLLIATTRGNQSVVVEGIGQITFGVNVYRPNPAYTG